VSTGRRACARAHAHDLPGLDRSNDGCVLVAEDAPVHPLKGDIVETTVGPQGWVSRLGSFWRSIAFLCFVAGLGYAGYKVTDKIVLHNVLNAEDF
jgi:hypothetical protein